MNPSFYFFDLCTLFFVLCSRFKLRWTPLKPFKRHQNRVQSTKNKVSSIQISDLVSQQTLHKLRGNLGAAYKSPGPGLHIRGPSRDSYRARGSAFPSFSLMQKRAQQLNVA